MNDMTTVRLQIQIPAEQIAAAVALRQEDLSGVVKQGINNALESMTDTLVNHAKNAAVKAIEDHITAYFGWGAGREQIKVALESTLTAVTDEITKAAKRPKKGGPR